MDESSSPSTSSTRLDAPSATFDVFAQLVRHAETDAAGGAAGAAAAGSGQADGERRTKLFMMATKLAKLNLVQDTSSSASSSLAIWETVLQFLRAYPDYIFYRPAGVAPTTNGHDGNHNEEEEEMGAWLLPRLLRRLAVLGAEARPSEKVNKLKESAEGWLSSILIALSKQFYAKEWNGVAKQREYVHELLSLLKHVQALLQSTQKTAYPTKLWMLEKTSRLAPNGAGKDPFLDSDKRHKRPFAVLVQSVPQARALFASLAKTLVSVVTASPIWLRDVLPELVEVIIGSDQDWNIPTDAKGKAAARVPDSAIVDRLETVKTLTSSRQRENLPDGAVTRCFARLLEFYEHAVLAQVEKQSDTILVALLTSMQALSNEARQDPLTASIVQHCVSNNEQALLAVLQGAPPVLDVETGKAEVSLSQAITLLLLSVPMQSSQLSDEIQSDRTASECMSIQGKASLQVWLQQQPAMYLAGDNSCTIALLEAVGRLSRKSASSKKRKQGEDAIEGLYQSQVEQALKQSGLEDGSGWVTHGWQAALAKILDTKAADSPMRTAIDQLIRIEAKHRSETQEQEDLPESESEMLLRKRVNLDIIHRALLRSLASRSIEYSTKDRAATWSTLSSLAELDSRPPMLTDKALDVLFADLRHKNRLVRLGAGQAGNALVTAHQANNPALDGHGHVGKYFDNLTSIIGTDQLSRKGTAVTAAAHLCRTTEDGILGRALCLLLHGLAFGGPLKALITTQVGMLVTHRKTSVYKLFSPHFDQLCSVLAQKVDSSFSLLHAFCQLIQTAPKAFVTTTAIMRVLLASAVMQRRKDIVQQLAFHSDINAVKMLVLNADCVFAPLYLASASRLEESLRFLGDVFKENGVAFSSNQLLESSLCNLIFEVLIRLDTGPSGCGQLKIVLKRIYLQLDPRGQWTIHAQKSSTILAVVGRAGDVLRGEYGKKSTAEKLKVLKGLGIYAEAIGAPTNAARHQIMAILQSCFQEPAIRQQTLLLWQLLLTRIMIFDDAKSLFAQTTASFVQAYSELSDSEKESVHEILKYVLVDKKAELGTEVHSIANMDGIPELERFQAQLLAQRQQQTFTNQLTGFLARLDTINEIVLVQTLQELATFLQQQAAHIHKLASGNLFDSILGQTVHELLSVAIRNAEAKNAARPLALRCLGILGALDPDRLTFPAEEGSFPLTHDLRDEAECMAFAQYTIEKVLVKVLRSTTDPHQQSALFLAIQGMAAVCGFDTRTRANGHFQPGVEATVRQRWNAVPKAVQDTIEPIISAQIDLQRQSVETNVYPLYTTKPSYRQWLQAWTSDLITQLVQGHAGVVYATGKNYGPKALFEPLSACVRGSRDASVAYYLLPYLIFYAVGVGNTTLTTQIRQELEVVLQDRIAPRSDMLMTEESRSLCAQAIFELMDNLNTWVRLRHVYIARKYRKRDPHRNIEATTALVPVRRIEQMLQALPQNAVADAAFNSKSYARALLNYEKILSDQKQTADIAVLQPYYERLHNIYAELNEPDGMEGVSTSIISPSIQHQIREHEMTGRWTSAQSCWEVQLQLHPEDPDSHLGLLRCLRNLGHYDSLRTHIAGLQTKHGEWRQLLSPFEIESALIAGDLYALADACSATNVSSPEAAFGQFVLAKANQGDINAARNQAAEQLGGIITTASKDSYYRFYEAISNLHVLHELDMLLVKDPQKPRHNPSRADLASLTNRLDLTAPSFQTREAILNMRRNAYRISAGTSEPNIGPLWLSTSKIALKADHLQTAYSAILQASQLRADFTFVQSAKLYRANDQLYRALQEIEQGLKGLGAFNSASKQAIDPAITKQLAKATLRSARWMQDTGRFDAADINARYKRAITLDPNWEAAYYRFGQYADDVVQSSPDFVKNALPNTPTYHRNTQLLLNMDLVVHNFSKALRFGAKFLYQSLPRLLTIWLDFAARDEFRNYDPNKGLENVSTGRDKVRRVSANLKEEPAIVDGRKTFDKIATNVRRAYDKLPPYMWLAVLPQLASRLWHDNTSVCTLLVLLVERTVHYYPQQAVWTMIGTLHSEVKTRRERGNQILQRAQSRNAQGQAGDQLTLRRTISTLNSLVESFLDISSCSTDPDGNPLSIKARFPGLRQMVPCNIIIPFQDSMIVTLPTDPSQLHSHKPFPTNLVTFKGFEDTIELMNSVARPRKLVIEGSDGRKYRFLCKPMDDLRKDNRLMDCTSLINRLLMKDAGSRKRSLRIRTYAVIPLSEKCGLIEWVPDTAGIRQLWQKLYEPKGIVVWNDNLKRIYDTIKNAQKNDLAKCGEVFTNQILPLFPPVFHHWFLDHFPEPTAWLKARTSYGRTAAVMSMVGFVLGLGDRHGENILVDTTNGDVVHVDFNCLFGMGLVWFDIVEKVPFRLTQNVIDGFGITGVEGVFRNVCEITMRILRQNKTSLINVLESFVHDPLLDLQLSRPGVRKSAISGRSETKEQKAAREQEMRQEEARKALATIGYKLKGTQSTLAGPPGETVSSVEMTVETLFKEATDPKNLGGMYCGWSSFL